MLLRDLLRRIMSLKPNEFSYIFLPIDSSSVLCMSMVIPQKHCLIQRIVLGLEGLQLKYMILANIGLKFIDGV